MSDRLVNLMAFGGAAALVGASIVVILSGGAPLLSRFADKPKPAPVPTVSAPASAPAAAPSEPAQPSPISPNLKLEAAQRMSSGVYRCEDDGRIIYANQPCANGREVRERGKRGP